MGNPTATFDQRKLNQATEIVHALSHPLRLRIIDELMMRGEASVSDLQDSLDLEASVVSNHLRVMRQAGIVDTERQGKFIRFTVDSERLHSITAAINNFSFSFHEVEV